jgi:hypothetical protein
MVPDLFKYQDPILKKKHSRTPHMLIIIFIDSSNWENTNDKSHFVQLWIWFHIQLISVGITEETKHSLEKQGSLRSYVNS